VENKSMAKKEYKDYTVLILGAGMGTRLRPITNTIPKVMVEIAPGKPLLQHTIELLRDQGFRNFIINVHYLPEKIIEYFGNGEKFGVSIIYSDESERLMDTAGAIKKVENLLSDTFLFMYGDELHFFDFRPLIDIHEKNNAEATIVLKKTQDAKNADLAELDTISGRIKKWHKRPHGVEELGDDLFGNAGLYVLSKDILKNILVETPTKLDGDVIPEIIKQDAHRIFGFIAQEPIMDIGSPEKYEKAKKYYKTKKQSIAR
jgi:mannose-1-phosphate guanylyltransferase/phosphomannomutase